MTSIFYTFFCNIPNIHQNWPSFITALHVMQTRYSEENSVRPSVRPSVCHTRELWQNGRKICSDLYTIRKNIYPTFLRRRMVGGGRPLLREILGQPRWNEIANFQPIIARSSSAVTPSEKSSINATRFPMSLRWSSHVASKSPKGGLKNSKRPISIKKCTSLEESLLQSFFVWKLLAAKL